MAIDLKAGIDHAAFVRDVEKGMKLANRAMQKRANSIKLKLDDKGFRQPLGSVLQLLLSEEYLKLLKS